MSRSTNTRQLQVYPLPAPKAVKVRSEPENWATIRSTEELATSVAHDLIQPLSEIVNSVWICRELIGNSSIPLEVDETLASIESQAMRAAELIRAARRLVSEWESGSISGSHSNPNDTV
jgi:hypothetical protein